jgi:hypothetical protein
MFPRPSAGATPIERTGQIGRARSCTEDPGEKVWSNTLDKIIEQM